MTRRIDVLALATLAVGCGEPPICGEDGLPDCPPLDAVFRTVQVGPDAAAAALPLAGAHEVLEIGDVDGDGRTDLAARFDGEIRVYTHVLDEWTEAAVLEVASDVLAPAGDLDDDDQADLVVGDRTRMLVFRGADLHGTLQAGDAAMDVVGTGGRDLLSVAGRGDVDGDGVDDLVVSEHDAAKGQEYVRVILGGDLSGTRVVGDLPGAYGAIVDGFLSASAALFDYDGDRLADIATGALRKFAAVHAGSSFGGSEGHSDKEVRLLECADCGGVRVAAGGDVVGRGYDSLLLTAFPDEQAWVVPGVDLQQPRYNWKVTPGEMPDRLQIAGGHTLWGPGDLSGDGYAEVLAAGAAGAFLFTGSQLTEALDAAATDGVRSLDLTDATHHFVDFGENTRVAPAGDLDADGTPDLVVLADETLYLLLTPEHDSE